MVQRRVGTGEFRREIVERVVYDLPADDTRAVADRIAFDLAVAEWIDFPDIVRHPNGLGAGVARVRRYFYGVSAYARQQCEALAQETAGASRSRVDASVFQAFAEADGHRVAAGVRAKRQPELSERVVTEVGENEPIGEFLGRFR